MQLPYHYSICFSFILIGIFFTYYCTKAQINDRIIRLPFLESDLEFLYSTYLTDLKKVRALAIQYCEIPKPDGWPHHHRCQSAIAEMELLYLLIRHQRPKTLLEACSAVGYTTLWILKALNDNQEGKLWSFDIYPTPLPEVLQPISEYQQRWKFTQGDIKQTIQPYLNMSFDRLIIDADHSEEFTKWYTKAILDELIAVNLKSSKPMDISVHDIWQVLQSGKKRKSSHSTEGKVILNWLSSHSKKFEKDAFNAEFYGDKHSALMKIRSKYLGEEDAQKVIGIYSDSDFMITLYVRFLH